MAKRKLDDAENCIKGYVHDVTGIQTASNSGTRYFKGELQVGHNEFVDFVSFSPEKQRQLKSAETTQSAVEVKSCDVTPKGTSRQVIMHRSSIINICRKLDFTRATSCKKTSDNLVISDIVTSDTTCSIKAKVLAVPTSVTVNTKYGERIVQTINIGDCTGTIKLALWQHNANKVNNEKSYFFQNLISREYQGVLQLSTTKDTVLTEIDDIDSVAKVTETAVTKEGVPISCQLKKTFRCCACNKAIQGDVKGDLIKCLNCLNKIRVSRAVVRLSMNLQIDCDGQILKLFVSHEAIQEFLEENSLTLASLDEIENFILMKDLLEVDKKEDTEFVSKLKVK